MVFEEKQSLSKLWWVFIPIIIGPTALLIGALAQENPAEKQEMLTAFVITLCILAVVVGLLVSMRLITRIDSKGVSISYIPFIRKKTYTWLDIDKAWLRKYNPIGEYGGWGIKGSFFKKGTAYNVWGNKGLQLYLKNGKRVLIGTQKATEMAAFLTRLKEKHQIAPLEKEELDG